MALSFVLLAGFFCAVALGVICPVGYGKIGKAKDVEYSKVWYRFCGKEDYCYRASTEDYQEMKKIYPEHDWDDTHSFYEGWYILQCGGDFNFEEERGCAKRNPVTIVESNSHPNPKIGKRERLEGFSTDYCCYGDYCTSGAKPLFSKATLGVTVALAVACSTLIFGI